ncbi:hypothetical protein P3578_24395, partial [Vibrio parahaemolyticus]|nr:hypothetical protein [Vibrio parahaemolyticus]
KVDASHTSSTPQPKKIYTVIKVSRWAPKISVTNPVSNQIFPLLYLSYGIESTEKVFLQNIMMSQ